MKCENCEKVPEGNEWNGVILPNEIEWNVVVSNMATAEATDIGAGVYENQNYYFRFISLRQWEETEKGEEHYIKQIRKDT